MSDKTINVIHVNNWKCCVSRWPDRKRPSLSIQKAGTNEWWVLASFNSDKAAEAFDAFLGGDLDAYVSKQNENPTGRNDL